MGTGGEASPGGSHPGDRYAQGGSGLQADITEQVMLPISGSKKK